MKTTKANRQQGMTLVEVLVALAILAITGVALMSSINGALQSTDLMQEKTIAHWIGMNKAADLQMRTKWPDLGTKREEIEMVGREWHIEVITKASKQPKLREITIKVKDDPKEKYSLSLLTLYMGEKQ